MSLARHHFFDLKTVTAAAFPVVPDFDFGFRATGMMLTVDTPGDQKYVEFSLNARDLDGRVYRFERHLVFDFFDASKLWLRSAEPINVRVWAWVQQR